MAQLNDNFISFVGPDEQMRQILLTMARNHLAAVPELRERGFDWVEEEPYRAERLSEMGVSELAGFLREQAVDPLVLFDPATKNYCTSDDYVFDAPCKIRGTQLWELDLDFCSGSGGDVPLDYLGAFGTLLPSGTYSFGGFFRYEGDESFYLDWGEFQCGPEDAEDFDEDRHFWYQDESVWPRERARVLKALTESARGESTSGYVAVSLAHAVANSFYDVDLPGFAGLKHAQTTDGGTLERRVLELLGEFPVLLGVRLMESPDARWWQTASPGMPLVVVSTWTDEGEAVLEARAADGKRLGPVYRMGGLSRKPYTTGENDEFDDAVETLAFVLPHLVARFYGTNPDTAFIRLEFAGPIDVGKLIEEVRVTLAKPAGERVLATKEER